MTEKELDKAYWSQRYRDGSTGWDIGYAAPQLMAFASEFDKSSRILIPGCGHAWEAEVLHREGYTEVYIVDWSQEALDDFAARVPDFPQSHLICADFFGLKERYDLILEQTFYCALPPKRRDEYVLKMHELLFERGVLAGLLFDFPLTEDGPPFGGSKEEYETRFSPFFELDVLERSALSIEPRAGRELAFRFKKKEAVGSV